MFPYFTVFGRTIGSYAVCAVVGMLFCGFVACRLVKRVGITVDDTVLTMLAIVGGIAGGGSLLYALTNLPTIINILAQSGQTSLQNTARALLACFGGLVFYGGFLGGLATLRSATKRWPPARREAFTDAYAVTTPLFHTFGRIGCFLGGCCYGIESRFGFLITDNPLSPAVCGVVRFPVQLIEAAGNLALFLLLLYLYRRERLRGRLLTVYLLTYPPMRFVLELLRGDEVRGILFGLSTSQWISLLLLSAALITVLRRKSASTKHSAL